MNSAGHGFITTDWADGVYTFRLEYGHWFELQEKCSCGPSELLERLVTRKWLAEDIEAIIRLGLIGGGKTPVEALKLVRVYVHERPLLENVGIAVRIVSASLVGPDYGDNDAGELPATAVSVSENQSD